MTASPENARRRLGNRCETAAVIRRFPAFSAFGETEIFDLIGASRRQVLPAGSCIYRVGERADGLILLVEGKVRSTISTGLREVTLAATEVPGSIIGVINLVDRPHLTSAICDRDSELIRISTQDLNRVLAKLGKGGRSLLVEIAQSNWANAKNLVDRLHKEFDETSLAKSTYEARVNLEQLLLIFSSKFATVSPDRVEGEIDASLSLLAAHLGADKASIVASADRETAFQVFSRHGDAPVPDAGRGQASLEKSGEHAWEELSSHEALLITDTAALPARERAECESKGIKAFLRVPLVYRGSVKGHLQIDSFEPRAWPGESVTILKMIGEIMLTALERREVGRSMERLMRHDPLTGLPNRTALRDTLGRSLYRCAERGQSVVALVLDLDRFKLVNDSLGVAGGDTLLRGVARRLEKTVRATDVVARLSGDVFVVGVVGPADAQQGASVANKVRDALVRPFIVADGRIHVSASIGIASHPEVDGGPDALVHAAEVAMRMAKAAGGNCVKVYEASFEPGASRRLAIEHNIRSGIQGDRFEVYCQPQVRLSDGRMTGAEALVRWRQSDDTVWRPSEFLPIAEETGLIVPLSEMILEAACTTRVLWQDRVPEDVRIAVNVSGRWLRDQRFLSEVDRIIAKTRIAPTQLELELTEEILLRDIEANIDLLQHLRSRGITIALDDFGTGYSSLNFLRTLPIDLMKIDQSFVRSVPRDQRSTAIVVAMVKLARDLNLSVIAEGVEEPSQLEFLRSIGCEVAQGYLIAKPQCPRQFAEWLTGGASTVRHLLGGTAEGFGGGGP